MQDMDSSSGSNSLLVFTRPTPSKTPADTDVLTLCFLYRIHTQKLVKASCWMLNDMRKEEKKFLITLKMSEDAGLYSEGLS